MQLWADNKESKFHNYIQYVKVVRRVATDMPLLVITFKKWQETVTVIELILPVL